MSKGTHTSSAALAALALLVNREHVQDYKSQQLWLTGSPAPQQAFRSAEPLPAEGPVLSTLQCPSAGPEPGHGFT